jgi:hypothetical protein
LSNIHGAFSVSQSRKRRDTKPCPASGAPAALRPDPRQEMLAATSAEITPPPAPQVALPDSTGPPPDLLVGATAIAVFLFGTKQKRRAIYRLVEERKLPVFTLGGMLCARRRTLLDFLDALEGAALAEIQESSAA